MAYHRNFEKDIEIVERSYRNLSVDEITDECIAAIHYYSSILKQISPNKEFPIDRLIGYRGQATHDVQIMAKTHIDLWHFLKRFPRIFTVTDNMCVKLAKDASKNNMHREYSNKEAKPKVNVAVDYYAKILKSKGHNVCYSIIQLIGHRSQAPENVKLYAKNVEELYSLLRSYPTIFTVTPDNLVFLTNSKKSCDEKVENMKFSEVSSGSSSAVEYYLQILRRISPTAKYPILRLVGYRGQAPPDIQNVAKNELELTSFLSQHPKFFTVYDDGKVSLNMAEPLLIHSRNTINKFELKTIQEKEKCDARNKIDFKSIKVPDQINSVLKIAVDYYRSVMEEFGPNFECSIDQLSFYQNVAPPEVNKIVRNSSELRAFLSNQPTTFTVDKNKVFLSDRGLRKEKAVNFYRNILLNANDRSLKLQNLLEYCSKASPDVKTVANNKLQLSALLSLYPSIFQIQDGYVYLTDNRDKRCLYKKQSIFPSISHSFRKRDYRHWEDSVLSNTYLVMNISDCLRICKLIMKEKVIAVDCEGYNLGRGKISIIQIALVNGKIYIFDIFEDPNMIIKGGLKDIIESNEIVKVMHYCRNDSMNLILEFGVLLKNVFDTSVAYNVIENGLLTMSNFKPLGINQICSKFDIPENSCKDEVKDVYKTIPFYWLLRPLTQEMMTYAALDVASLVPYVYNELQKRLDDKTDLVVWKLSQKLCEL